MRHRLDYGTFEIKANWASSTADPLSDAQKNLELIEDILYNRVQGDVGSYSIAERLLSKMSPSDLITLRDFYKRQVVMEERKDRIRQNKGTGANILENFRRWLYRSDLSSPSRRYLKLSSSTIHCVSKISSKSASSAKSSGKLVSVVIKPLFNVCGHSLKKRNSIVVPNALLE